MRTLFEIGSTIVLGMGFTKLVGIIVLVFSPNAIVRVYFFRMYLCMLVLGLFNSVILLPLVLSFFGPDKVSLI